MALPASTRTSVHCFVTAMRRQKLVLEPAIHRIPVAFHRAAAPGMVGLACASGPEVEEL